MKKIIFGILKVLSWGWIGIWIFASLVGKEVETRQRMIYTDGWIVLLLIVLTPPIAFLIWRLIADKKVPTFKKKVILPIIAILILFAFVKAIIPTIGQYMDETAIKSAVYKDRLESVEILSVVNDEMKPGNVTVSFKVKGQNQFTFVDIADVTSITNPSQYKTGLSSEITLGSDDVCTINIAKVTDGTYELTVEGYAYDAKKLSEGLLEKYKNEVTFPIKTQFKVSNGYNTIAKLDKAISVKEKERLEDEARERANKEEEDKAVAAEEKAVAEKFEKDRYKQISDVGNTQTWRIYVEAERSLRVYGHAGNQLVIIISDESGKPFVSDMLWTGDYDKSYTLSNSYNGYYNVELNYIRENASDYNWRFQVE